MTSYRIYRWDGKDWRPVPFQDNSLAYCHGYVDAMDSLYPSPPYQILEYNSEKGTAKIIRETPGRSAPRPA